MEKNVKKTVKNLKRIINRMYSSFVKKKVTKKKPKWEEQNRRKREKRKFRNNRASFSSWLYARVTGNISEDEKEMKKKKKNSTTTLRNVNGTHCSIWLKKKNS